MISAWNPSPFGQRAEAVFRSLFVVPGPQSEPNGIGRSYRFQGLYLPESYFTGAVSSSKMPVTVSAIYRGCRSCTGFKTVKCRGRRGRKARGCV